MSEESDRIQERVKRALQDQELKAMGVKARFPSRTIEGPIQAVHVKPLERGYVVTKGDLIAEGDAGQRPVIHRVIGVASRGSNPIIWYDIEKSDRD